MSLELSILKLFCVDREIYHTVHGYVDSIKNMEREIKLLFNLIDTYYKEMEGTTISKDDLVNYYDIKYPKSKNRDAIMSLIGNAFSIEVNKELIYQSIDQLIEQHTATEMINKLLPVMEGEKFGVIDGLQDDINEYIDILHNPPEKLIKPEPCTLTVEELIEEEIMDDGIPWHLPQLTEIVGGVRSKTLGLIFAYTDSGKTSFSLASVAAFLKAVAGSETKICYAGNEESAQRMRLRLVQAILKWTKGQIAARPKEATEEALSRGLNNVLIFDEITSGEQIKYIAKEYKPAILFIDQATDVEIDTRFKPGNQVEYLKSLFKWYRRLANKADCAVIGVSQGVGEAENKKWLKLSDIYGSRVAIQGALDYAIGIGRKTDDPAIEDSRYIHVSKNKLNDGSAGKFTVDFSRTICKWKEI